MASFGSLGCPSIPGTEQIQTRVIRYPNTRVRISKHVCLEINFKKNAVLEQIFINFQDYSNHSLLTEQVRGSNFSKIVVFGVHNLCGVAFLMQKKKSEISFHSGVVVSFFFCVIHYVTVQRCF